jgi:hypothetical protein
METLEQALGTMQTVHAVVEQMALSVRGQAPAAPHIQKLKRTATPLVGLLKPQFGLISDLVAAMILASTRGASDKLRVRALRESVASIRMHIEVAQKRVEEQHMSAEELDAEPD